MLGIDNYIPETNHISRLSSVSADLYVQFVLHVMLFRIIIIIYLLIIIIVVVVVVEVNH